MTEKADNTADSAEADQTGANEYTAVCVRSAGGAIEISQDSEIINRYGGNIAGPERRGGTAENKGDNGLLGMGRRPRRSARSRFLGQRRRAPASSSLMTWRLRSCCVRIGSVAAELRCCAPRRGQPPPATGCPRQRLLFQKCPPVTPTCQPSSSGTLQLPC